MGICITISVCASTHTYIMYTDMYQLLLNKKGDWKTQNNCGLYPPTCPPHSLSLTTAAVKLLHGSQALSFYSFTMKIHTISQVNSGFVHPSVHKNLKKCPFLNINYH